MEKEEIGESTFTKADIDAAIQKAMVERDEQEKGLKRKVDELLSEKKQAQEEKLAAEERARKEAEEKAKANNDYKQLFESQQQEAARLKKQLDELNGNIKQQKVFSTAAKIAAGLTKDTARAKLLEQQISQRLTLVDEELRVTDDSGNLTVSTLDDLTTTIRTNFPFLVDGSQANGGGAARSSGGADGGRKEISRSDFDGMRHGDRAKFIKDGGKVIDD
jgi:DNA repair exonuclease SbcCD ATPase subunit